MTADDFAELWTSGNYVLARSSDGSGGLVPMEKDGSSAILIDDDELSAVVTRRMLDVGVPVVDIDAFPRGVEPESLTSGRPLVRCPP